MATKYTYDKKTDYQALINDAVGAGDYQSAALYEQQRNQKISDMDAAGTNTKGHQQTNLYSDYLTSSGTPQESAEYKSAYSESINSLLDSLQNGAKFSYDFDADPEKATYEKNAQGNFNDTLAQISARTGGLASSYAGQASQQAYQDTMDNAYSLLRSQAYDQWQNERTDQYNMLSTLMGLDETAYGRFVDQRSYNDSLDDAAAQKQSEAASILASAGDFSGYQSQYGLTDAQVETLKKAYAREDEETLAALMAQYGMYDDYVRLLGGTEEQASALKNAYAASQTYTTGGSSGSSGSAGAEDAAWVSAREKLYQAGVGTSDAYNWLLDAGYSSTEAKEIAAGYTNAYISDMRSREATGMSDYANLLYRNYTGGQMSRYAVERQLDAALEKIESGKTAHLTIDEIEYLYSVISGT